MGNLDRKAISAAAALLWRHWTAGTKLPHLPEDSRPLDRSDGYAVQAAVVVRTLLLRNEPQMLAKTNMKIE